MADYLNVWRDGEIIAVLERLPEGVRLEYLPTAKYPISLALPLEAKAHNPETVKNWLENLLPERLDVLNSLANQIGLTKRSFWELLHYIGGDLAGDLTILPEGATPKVEPPVLVSEEEITRLIYNAKTGANTNSLVKYGDRLSLAGMQTKFSLALINGYWFKPTAVAPSTHIFKPGNIEHVEELEAAAQTLARVIGVRAAVGFVAVFNGQTTYCTERFDREWTKGGIRRRHQEDLAQVLGITKRNKYGATFKDAVRALTEAGMSQEELYTLVQLMVFNVHVGNTDAHGKNYSVRQDDSGKVYVAPLYDCVPVLGYGGKYSKSGLSMPVNGKRLPPEITLNDWLSWSNHNGLNSSVVEDIVVTTTRAIKGTAVDVFRELRVPDVHVDGVLAASDGIKYA